MTDTPTTTTAVASTSKLQAILNFIVARAKERSTWLGLISCATALGLAVSTEQQEAIIAAGIGAAGLIAAFTTDKAS
ncbi:MAG: hypothetical protein PW788_02685 [Micavibrio sp.]|nr:hypothetical protein [Micavibrio sp.]